MARHRSKTVARVLGALAMLVAAGCTGNVEFSIGEPDATPVRDYPTPPPVAAGFIDECGLLPVDEATIELARTIQARIPADPRIQARRVSGPCAAIDLKVPGEVLGEPLTTTRQQLGADHGTVSCLYAGRAAGLNVKISSDPDDVAGFEARKEHRPPVRGVGDEAHRPFEDAPLSAVDVRIGNQIATVNGTLSSFREPSEAEARRLLASIVESIG